MLCFGEQLTGCLHERIGLGLQVAATALFDFGCALGQPGKEGVHLLARFSGRAKAGVRRHFSSHPFPKWPRRR